MFFKPVISGDVFDEFMGMDYAIIFFPKVDETRFLYFRKQVEPLVWHLIEQKLHNYTSVRRGWIEHMVATRGVKIGEGVAFFKKGVLRKEMAGFDLEGFKLALIEFDANNPNDGPSDSLAAACCDCIIL
ncbi:hypothetical protein COEREDRAFT_86196 [Coemansia reversa NRRL 1564]|uniref:Uncharacterized protein n=1 Tax=Coemansia reversa (strain ATCC 12441 / NRRL 1564) TaxID=763665 RepID=A0A2G5BDU4_COERN|nr:hypothetical protein COEREDRAFT_86196 [Coemansia reversa NRRL 1564]|eukprot:PIA17190.1 hypothetical protein COEREDRAFT_86196 [Coemansia reversa NRRL 1564]